MPPILYGVVAQQFHTTLPVSIDALFKAGVLPFCLLMVVLLASTAFGTSVVSHRLPRASAGELGPRSRMPPGNPCCRS